MNFHRIGTSFQFIEWTSSETYNDSDHKYKGREEKIREKLIGDAADGETSDNSIIQYKFSSKKNEKVKAKP